MGHALLFDMDGTLIDSDPLHIEVFIGLLSEYGIEISRDDYMDDMHGRRNEQIFADVLPDENPEALAREKEARFRSRLDELPGLMPGVLELLDSARGDGWRIAAVTNAERANLDAVLDRFELRPHFDFAISAEEVDRGKPDPLVYLTALSQIGADASRSLVFEDSPSGIEAGVRAGATVIGMESSLSAAKLRDAGAFDTIPDFTDPKLDRLLAQVQGAAA